MEGGVNHNQITTVMELQSLVCCNKGTQGTVNMFNRDVNLILMEGVKEDFKISDI